MGVWKNCDVISMDGEFLDRNREGTCFFMPYVPTMTFKTARELELRKANRDEAARDRALTQSALEKTDKALRQSAIQNWITLGALVVSALALIFTSERPHSSGLPAASPTLMIVGSASSAAAASSAVPLAVQH